MPTFEVELSDEVYSEIQALVGDDFVSREQALEELIGSGIEAYNTTIVDDSPEDDFIDGTEANLFDTAGDPGKIDDDDRL
ncbi:MAG: hypothetical protein A07HR60_00860 [uncultured archaeon A07HR60]|jgi:hypothetical protein|nr:MAG: hypothetical protein A07HR60_00855 [uncultured archaeon A07HR60]ESS12316.1 MAG: hypothetical protein A07HR60_00860 [uncultured archaeon A07HR60]